MKPGGSLVQVDMGREDVSFPIAAACSKELNIKGSFRYGPGDYDTAIELMASQRVNVTPLITKIVPLERAEEAFVGMGDGSGIKTIIKRPSFAIESDEARLRNMIISDP